MQTENVGQSRKAALGGVSMILLILAGIFACIVFFGGGFLAFRLINGQNENQRLQILIQATQTAEANYFALTQQSHLETLTAPTSTLEPSPVPSNTATMEPVATNIQTTSTPESFLAVVDLSLIYLRAGPCTNHKEVAGPYSKGIQVEMLGRYRDDWFYVKAPDGKEGWAYKTWITFVNLDINDIPTMTNIPTCPTPPPSATETSAPSTPLPPVATPIPPSAVPPKATVPKYP